MSGSIGLYRAGTSTLHRAPAAVKVGTLLVSGAGSILVDTPSQAVTVLAGSLLLYPAARLPLAVLLGSITPVLWIVVPLGVFQLLATGPSRTVVVVAVILTLILLANLVTLTTRTSDLVEVAVSWSRPLSRLGVDPLRVGLALDLGIRCVPLVAELATEVRDARRARGLEGSARALAVPLLVRALRRAEEMGDALAARGCGD